MSMLKLVKQFEFVLYSLRRKISTKKEKSNKAIYTTIVAKFYSPLSNSQTVTDWHRGCRMAKAHLWPVRATDGLRPSVSRSHDLFSLYILLSVP